MDKLGPICGANYSFNAETADISESLIQKQHVGEIHQRQKRKES